MTIYQNKPTLPIYNWFDQIRTSEVGYSTQPRIALDIAMNYYSNKYYIWFSLSINPSHGKSARPLWIYDELSEVVNFSDKNHPKVQSLMVGLLRSVAVRLPRDRKLQRHLAREIENANIEWFRPQLLKIKIGNGGVDKAECRSCAIKNGATYSDEYLLENGSPNHFMIIIE